MSDLLKGIYHSITYGDVGFDRMVEAVELYINEEQTVPHRIIIGTDSLPNGNVGIVNFVSAVVVHRVGRGGIYFWYRQKISEMFNLRPRIQQEAWISIELAKELVQRFNTIPEAGRQIEIHVDIGSNGPTRELIKEVIGMVVGSGFDVKMKPEAFAASKVADRHTTAAYK